MAADTINISTPVLSTLDELAALLKAAKAEREAAQEAVYDAPAESEERFVAIQRMGAAEAERDRILRQAWLVNENYTWFVLWALDNGINPNQELLGMVRGLKGRTGQPRALSWSVYADKVQPVIEFWRERRDASDASDEVA
jgi:hypothetical protein